jgi:ferritin-like metal-binding protein YciE
MNDLFVHQLQDIYYAEKQLVKALPTMAQKAAAWAKQLGRDDCASVLQKTLDEEKATDAKLTKLAESRVNLRAAS